MAFNFGQLGFGLAISLRDMFTQNAQRISGSMGAMANQSVQTAAQMQRSFGQVTTGAAMMGAGVAMIGAPLALLSTTRETQRALGEVSSLGIRELHALELAAQEFSNQWAGTSKAQFIAASYDIKSAISTLSDAGVAEFAGLAALTGKATKATTQEMSALFATGYGIYKGQFEQMSDMDFGAMFSGGISKAVQNFKTTGPQMADAIKNIGALAVSANIPMAEQLAILGQLQTTMPGSEAGTLYKNFVMKAGEAGKELGLQFQDAQGHMLGVVPIIQALQSKFPDLASQAAQFQIKKAFGSDEAVKFVLQMARGIGTLEGNIESMSTAMKTGTALTMEMARAMNMDIGSRIEVLQQRWQNLVEVLGVQLIPVVTPVIDRIGELMTTAQKAAAAFPGVTRAILTASMALGGLLSVTGLVVASVGTLGLFRLGWGMMAGTMTATLGAIGSGLAAAFLPLVIGMAASAMLRRAWDRDFGGLRTTVTQWYDRTKLVVEALGAVFGSLTGSTGAMSADLAQRLKSAGLYDFTKQVAMGLYRVKAFSEGLVAGFSTGFETVARVVMGAANLISIPLRPVIWLVSTLVEQIGWLVPITANIQSDRFTALGTAIGVTAGALVALIGTWRAWQLVQEARMGAMALIQGAQASLGFWQWAAGAMAREWSRRFWQVSQSAQTLVARLSTMNAATIWSGATARLTMMRAAFLANIQAARAWAIATVQSARTALVSLATNARAAVVALAQVAVQYVRLGLQLAVTSAQMLAQRAAWAAMNVGSIITSLGAVVVSYAQMGAAMAMSTARIALQTVGWIAYQSTMIGVKALTLGWTAAQWALNIALSANPVGAVILGVALLGAAVVGIIRHWDTFKVKLWEFGAVLLDMPFLQPVKMAWQMVQGLYQAFTGQISWQDAGAKILVTIGEGILSMITWPFRLVWKAFELVRQLLPFSNAQAGPFSNLTGAGMAILTTIGQGIMSVASLPLQLLSGVFSSALAGAANIWSGLTSLVSGGFETATSVATSLGTAYIEAVRANFQMAVDIAGSVWSGVTGVVSAGWESAKGIVSSAWQSLSQLGEASFNWMVGATPGVVQTPVTPALASQAATPTKAPPQGAFTVTTTNLMLANQPAARTATPLPGLAEGTPANRELLATRTIREHSTIRETVTTTAGQGGDSLERTLQALVAKLGEAGDRPIQLTVQLDGRQIAASVYENMRQKRVMNYE